MAFDDYGSLGYVTTDSGDIYGVDDCDGLGVLVLGMVLFSVDLFVLLEVLGTFKRLFADL